jgi:molybdopterin-containing oxidoreductase family iron-sulfur binding subunit
MLDACPHHHEENDSEPASLDGLNLRSPRTSQGKRFWRSLDELVETKSFTEMLHREFPHAASEWKDEPSRRNFLKLMSASLALGGLTACTLRKTSEKIVPYVNPPEEVVAGRPLYFASTMPWCGYAKGVVVESHEGRPTKIEGNTDHPASLGASDVWMQASVLDLYDPDRSKTVIHGDGNVSTWGAFTAAWLPMWGDLQQSKGKGLRFLTGTVTSPTIARQLQKVLKEMPLAKWHQYEPVGRNNARDGAIAAFGRDFQTVYQFENADVVVALDRNFLTEDPGSLAYARRFIDNRRIRQGADAKMNRLYVVETGVTPCGAMADHRLALKNSDIEPLIRELAAALGGVKAKGETAKWVNALAADLQANKGRSVVIVGESQPPAAHALVHAINETLGNVGSSLIYIDPVEAAGPDGPNSLDGLVSEMHAGEVDVLVVMDSNPAFTAPYELGFVAGENGDKDAFKDKNPLSKVKTIIHHGGYFDETAFFSHWHIPASHYLESWGDARAFDGTASITQPLIFPLYETKSVVEVLGFMTGEGDRGGYEIIRDTWKDSLAAPFEASWQRGLEKGVLPRTAFAAQKPALKLDLASAMSASKGSGGAGVEIVFRPDPTIWDGRYANNAWLQELPKPLTLLTWDNVALMSLNTAKKYKVIQDDPGKSVGASVVELKYRDRMLKLPAVVLPGHADDSVTIYMGYGRSRAGSVGNGKGGNVYDIRPGGTPWFGDGLGLSNTGEVYTVATTQSHHLIDIDRSPKASSAPDLDESRLEDRELFHLFTLDEYKSDLAEMKAEAGTKKARTIELPLLKPNPDPASEELISEWKYENNKWGMVIDNNACIGCNACVVACQSENNIPVVGREQVIKGREMHWIRIDTYFEGSPSTDDVDVYFQPVPCMQCENAPCELVCPVEATTHSEEGINEQTYNRCVGTRYCSNNCPYKVRRFNFLYYNDYKTPSLMLVHNPNVTVRGRGVMEKCNYCIQRINLSRIHAKIEDRPIKPDELVTACAQACPTQAILFGNLNDDKWEATKLQDEPVRYTLLDELNTKPRTSYLARLKNPNPALV